MLNWLLPAKPGRLGLPNWLIPPIPPKPLKPPIPLIPPSIGFALNWLSGINEDPGKFCPMGLKAPIPPIGLPMRLLGPKGLAPKGPENGLAIMLFCPKEDPNDPMPN